MKQAREDAGPDDVGRVDVLAGWSVLLLTTMAPEIAEQTLRVSVEEHDPDRSPRMQWWRSVWEAVDRDVEPTDPALLPLDLLGPDPGAVLAVGEFVRALPDPLRRVSLAVFVAGLDPDETMDATELDAGELRTAIRAVEHAAMQRGVVPPRSWRDSLAALAVPFDVDELLGSGEQGRIRSLASPAAALLATALVIALVWSSAPGQFGSGRDEATSPPSTEGNAPPGDDCVASSVVAGIRVSPVYQRRLESTALVDAIVASDAVVRGVVTEVRSDAGDVAVEVADLRIVSGVSRGVPAVVRLEGRSDPNASGSPIEIVAFLRRDSAGWVVSESGGLWASCTDTVVPVGADWMTGAGWPADADLDRLVEAVEAVAADNRTIELRAHADGVSGGFRLSDGRLVVVDTVADLDDEPLTVALAPNEGTLAIIRSASFTITLSGTPCRVTETEDCASAVVGVDVESSNEAAASLLDIHVVTDSGELGDSGLAAVRSSQGTVRMVDSGSRVVRWSVDASADVSFVANGGDVAVVEADLVRVFDAASGEERWIYRTSSVVDLIPHGRGWLVIENGPPLRLRALDDVGGPVWTRVLSSPSARLMGRAAGLAVLEIEEASGWSWEGIDASSGELSWRTDVFALLDGADDSRSVDLGRGLLAAVDNEGAVSLIDVTTGRVRWRTQVPNAKAIIGIWINTLTVDTSSGRSVKLGLADGFILPP